MISEEEAQKILLELKILKDKSHISLEDKKRYNQHLQLCFSNFDYLIKSKTNKYKKFSNHEDLMQEGYIALINAIDTYNSSKGSFFWWAHKYLDTKISRNANQHSDIKYPLKITKKIKPRKEYNFPVIVDNNSPDVISSKNESNYKLYNGLEKLSKNQRNIICMLYGFDNEKMSLEKISNTLDININECKREIKRAFVFLRREINKK